MTWLRCGTRIRPSIAVALVATIASAAVCGSLLWGRASRRLLTPIIAYHESQYQFNRKRWQSDLDRARAQMDYTLSRFDTVTRLSDDPSGLSKNENDARDHTWESVRSAKSVVQNIGQVGRELRDAVLHENITIYHFHMKVYYEDLLKDRTAWLPQLPPSLQVERKMIELDLKRRYEERPIEDSEVAEMLQQYKSEPPPRLRRSAPM